MRGRTLLILCAITLFSAPAYAQGSLGDMKNPYKIAERAASCLSAYLQGGVPGQNPHVKTWSRTLLFSGAWSAQYGYSLRDLHLINTTDTFGCEDDIKTIIEKFPDVIANTYKNDWKAAREKNKKPTPVLEEPGLRALSQAAWCAQALTTSAQAMQDAPEDFGFNTTDGDLAKATALSRGNAQLWEDRLAAQAPSGSYSANIGDQARAAFLSWNADLSAQKEKSFWINFLANEIYPCNTLGSALGAPADDL
ncbi:MAG: hypothetical protein KJ017_00185 [Alphaproteobacteria bacterium]|nr:hypothetical protein [Alphaproteobacteria bacterium]